jgi:predicted transposase/invertase (TIGR01784 family)
LERGIGTQQAIKQAIDYCIYHNILSDFLTAHKAEVLAMLLEEYNAQETMDYLWREAFEDGEKIGLERGLEQGLEQGREDEREKGRIAMLTTAKKLLALNMPPEQVSQVTGLSIAEINDMLDTKGSPA